MARLFDDAKSQYAENANAVLSAVPITMACWFRSNNATTPQALVSIDKSTGSEGFTIRIEGHVGGDPVAAITTNAGTQSAAYTTSGYSANTWHHAAAVFAAINDRRAYIDGGSKGTDATSRTPAGLDRTGIGARIFSGAATQYMSGRIAEAAIWNVALTDDEVAELAAGASPLLVRPDALVAYWPLVGRSYPEPDLVGTFPMSLYPVSTDTGWVDVGTGASDSGAGTEPWQNPGNITADDGSYADVNSLQWSNNEFTELLKGTNLGLSVAGEILGIEVRAEMKSSFVSGDDKISRVSLVKAGVVQAYDHEAGETNVPNSWTFMPYGGASDLWSDTWTASDVNNAGFGFVFQCVKRGGGNVTPQVDVFQAKVTSQDCACPADHPPVMFYPALDQAGVPPTTDGLNGALIGHLPTLGVGR